jgi:competence protein ComEC
MIGWGRARERIATWPTGIAAARGHARRMPEALRRLGELLRRWALAELAPGRLMPWLPVAFGLGIAAYFTAEREPALWAVVPLAIGTVAIAWRARHRPVALPVVLAIAAAVAGFAVATVRTAAISHPVLRLPAWNVDVSGWIEVREQRERSDRIVVRVQHLDAARMAFKPDRIRVAVRKDTAPPVGSFVHLKARLSPPLAPLHPGGYDYARDLYFQGLGASGFVLGKIERKPAPGPPGLWLRYSTAISSLRDDIDGRIRAVVSGDRGSIASALITGKRDAISAPVNNAMYVSGLGHILSISGYHMVVVAGVVFFTIRALLALFPALAGRAPIKKWAALAALGAATFYLLLSGAEVATQRSFIMIAIVLVGVMLDRQTLTLRSITVAALGVLIVTPETLVHPSFQMSFAATLALVAVYQWQLHLSPGADSSFGTRAALWGAREIVTLVIGSAAAGFATTMFAAYHFHRLAPYGVLANLLAMPIVSAWIMPVGLVGVLLMPFGFDAVMWRLMASGIDWMIAVALWVADLPGAVGRLTAFGTGPLMLGTAGLLVLCLLRTPLRLAGVGLGAVAALWAAMTPRPDILVSSDGRALAIRGADGRLSIARTDRDTFAARDWLGADADPRLVTDKSLQAGIRCDPNGCIGTLPDGRLVALSRTLEAFAEDCRRAVVVASPRDAPPGCAAGEVIDRTRWRQTGAVELYRHNDRFVLNAARPPGYDRPWSPAYAVPPPAASRTLRVPNRTPDATPRPEDLQPDDAMAQ